MEVGTAAGGPFSGVDSRSLHVIPPSVDRLKTMPPLPSLGIHAQTVWPSSSKRIAVPEVLASFPVHHNLPLSLEGQIDQGILGAGGG